jgi:hypothetical protein
MLGYFLGVVPAAIKFKARQWGMIHTQGLGSAQQLAVMSGMYTAVHCICQRIRMVEDGWNRGIAGCSTGARPEEAAVQLTTAPSVAKVLGFVLSSHCWPRKPPPAKPY